MIFSSLGFLFRFLPVFILLYYIAPKEWKNGILLAGSLCFYAIGEPKYFYLLILSCVVNYFFGRLIFRFRNGFLLGMGILLNVSVLGFFKYYGFFSGENLALPVGISFYTFQTLAYLIDIYMGRIKAENSPLIFGTYLCMFPQLTAGPLVSYGKIGEFIKERTCSVRMVENGLKTFVLGLTFKVLLANKLGILWNEIQTVGFRPMSTPMAWLGAFTYSMEIYFDFFGYSLMAIGLGKMLGFYLPENFNHPYISKTVAEFYRRWHITLGAWLRNYVYIPLGGNRRGIFKTCRNLLIVWMITGIWHGAGINYILWGFSLFLLIILEKYFLGKWLNKTHVLCRVYLLFVIPITWMMFAITDPGDLLLYLQKLFGIHVAANLTIRSQDVIYALQTYWQLLAVSVLLCTPFPYKIYNKIKNSIFGIILLLILFWWSVYEIYMVGFNPFMYYRF